MNHMIVVTIETHLVSREYLHFYGEEEESLRTMVKAPMIAHVIRILASLDSYSSNNYSTKLRESNSVISHVSYHFNQVLIDLA